MTLQTKLRLSRTRAILFAGLAAVVGVAILVSIFAAGAPIAFEAESGTLTSPATLVATSGASGGSAIRFGAATPTPTPSGTCNLNATTANFTTQVNAATAGQTVCLASGNYGTFAGVSKAVTIAAATGATPVMQVDFNTGDSGFTLDGMTGMGGSIVSGAKNITIRNATFTSAIVLDNLVNSGVTLDSDTFNNMSVSSCNGLVERIWIEDSTSATGVTVSNSTFSGGNMDGIRLDASGGATIIGNQFINVKENGPNDCQHSDSIQMYGGENNVIKNNYFSGGSDGIVAFDGTANNQITNNACAALDRGSCITLYSDKNSDVEHNSTVSSMSVLEIDHKSGDPAGTGTIYRNNVGSLSTANGSAVATNTNNLFSGASSPNVSGTPSFVGGSAPATLAGFKLTAGSTGTGRATDGTAIGVN